MLVEKPWLKFYEPHVPEHIDYPRAVLPAVLAEMAHNYPDHTAIIFEGARLTYQAFNEAVDRFAAALQDLGIEKGDRVALHLPNCVEFPIAYYAVLRAGGVVVICNPLCQVHETTCSIKDSGAQIIVTLDAAYPLLKRLRADAGLLYVIVSEPTLSPSSIFEKPRDHTASIAGDANTYWFTDLLTKTPPKPQPVEVMWNDTAVLMYMGDIAGAPKGAEFTHKNILANACQCKVWVNASEGKEIVLAQLPLSHVYGMTACMNLAVLTAGAMVLIHDPCDTGNVLKAIDAFCPTLYPGVPAMYMALNTSMDPRACHINRIKACLSGSAGMPIKAQQLFQQRTGARIVEGYGLNEVSMVTHANPVLGQNRAGTIGLPWPDTEARIADADTGERSLDICEAGELCIRGPQVMKGYWNLPLETANALHPDPEGGDPWLYTGDIAMMDEDGYFQIVDRKKDVISSASGYNIYPDEIEAMLCRHPKVLEAAMTGALTGGWDERTKAYVVLKPGERATEEEILAFCQETLAAYLVPKRIAFHGELPKNANGQVLRRLLAVEELKKEIWTATAFDHC